MAKHEYTIGDHDRKAKPSSLGGRHGGPMGMPGEKANDFSKTMKQLLSYCNPICQLL